MPFNVSLTKAGKKRANMTGILDTILHMSLYGALVGLAALAVSRALNHLRAPKGVALVLWAMTALRLLCPVALSGSDY